MSQNSLNNIDRNVVRIGNTQDVNFKDILSKLKTIESNQNGLNQNLSLLDQKLNKILEILGEN